MHREPKLSMQTDAEVSTVRAMGEVDLASSRDLASRLGEAAGAGDATTVLDLSRVTFMDSVGLGVVLQAANRFHRQGKRLLIVVPPGPVRRLFDFAGVADRLSLLASRDEVAAALTA
jgi:anti-sigma B factor antagonist